MLLTAVEARVLGSLMEKETTTPEQYPLSLNALIGACNQKSSREPVMQLGEREVHGAVRSLEDHGLVRANHGNRVERFENQARTVFALRRDEAAVLCLLLLRGPQTPGELRSRAERLFPFDDVTAVLATLQRMAEPLTSDGTHRREALVSGLPRQPGAREQRYQHLLCGSPDASEMIPEHTAHAPVRTKPTDIQQLEAAVAELFQRVTALEEVLSSYQHPPHAENFVQHETNPYKIR